MSNDEISDDELFDAWNEKKKRINKSGAHPLFKEGEIWWYNCGKNVGIEMNGGKNFLRPILIFNKLSFDGFVGILISKQPHVGDWFTKFEFRGNTQYALISQIKTTSSLRLVKRMGEVNATSMATIRLQFRKLHVDKR